MFLIFELMFESLLEKVGIKVSFESDKIVMTKNNVFVGKDYCSQGLFILNIFNIITNENASTSFAYLHNVTNLWRDRFGHISFPCIRKMNEIGLISSIINEKM